MLELELPLPPEHRTDPEPEATLETAAESSGDRAVRLAIALMELGVTDSHVKRLLIAYDLDRVERQISWLQFRRFDSAARMIVAAIDNDYEMPASLEAQLKQGGQNPGKEAA